MAVGEGTKEGANAAVVYFERTLNIGIAIDCAEKMILAESNIAVAKAMYEGRNVNKDELLAQRRTRYKFNVEQLGEEASYNKRWCKILCHCF
mmetsp:Transcript_4232/g.9557  ORF Transcript_4232/g.9557 Transcript_4232/m.9557 type:complete len:92 (+) Transcript_4232:11536-11811(+)